MADSLAVDYDYLRREIGVRLDFGREPASWSSDQRTDSDVIIEDGLRDFYFPLNPKTGRCHRWSFLYPQATITTTEPYSTGTITVVDGVVTLASGTFPSWAAQGEIQFDSTVYDVDTRDSNTQVTLIDTSTSASALTTYEIRQTKYDLPATFSVMDGPITYGPQNAQTTRELLFIGEGDIRMMRAARTPTASPPYVCAVIPKPFDATTGQRWQLYIYPPDNAVHILWYRYQKNPLTVDSTDKYPYGGPQHARTVLYAVLAAAERKLQDAPSVYAAQFKEALIASIDLDQKAAAPDYPAMRVYQSTCSQFSNREGLACGDVTNSL